MKKPQVFTLAVNITLLASMVSCASYHSMESVSEKMDRYQPKNSGTPATFSLAVNEQQINTGRGPASSERLTPKLSYNNKQLYFMTLLDQYNKLSQYSSTPTVSINHCPANHSALIIYQESYSSFWPKKPMPKLPTSLGALENYPELQLSVSFDSPKPVVADIIEKEGAEKVNSMVQKALDSYVAKTYSELRTLCDTGASDNYYAFENLLSEIKKNDSISPTAIMKGTVFSNMALIKSLSRNTGRSIASGTTDTLGTEALARAKAGWVKEYLKRFK